MISEQQFNNWKLRQDEDNVLWLTFDRAGESSNVLDQASLEELAEIVKQLVTESHVLGVVIASGKKNGFIAGANIEEFLQFKNPGEARAMVRRVQELLNQLEALPMPTVALIHGFCLGGGMELALACRYRVASLADGAVLGLPEVKLGIQPGWGGTVRMTRLLGAPAALDLILSGRTVSSKSAAKLGLVDAAVHPWELEAAARYYIVAKPKSKEPVWWTRSLNLPFIRPLFARVIENKLKQKIKREHYPAPFAMLENWVKVGDALQEGLTLEADSIARLFATDTAKHLIRVFFLQQQMKALTKADVALEKAAEGAPLHVHVIGAGTMGGDIAAWCALKGFTVTLQDRSPQQIAPAMGRAAQLYKKKLKDWRAVQIAMDRLDPDPDGLGVMKADIVIEAIFENLEAKHQLLKTLEPQLKSEKVILATNTSSIRLEALNTVLKNPARLVGIHFFNPVAMMQLVEVVHAATTDPLMMKRAQAFVGKIGRLPLPVTSSPGFLVNRVLLPYLMEAMELLREGVPARVIDSAAVAFGMPMGPIELADKIGLDVCFSVASNLVSVYGGQVPEELRQLVERGELGVKTSRGFYRYVKGRKEEEEQTDIITATTPVVTREDEDLTDRLILRMLNEAVACLREGVVENADLLDGGMIFGTGFAPFRGGPMQYAKERGVDAIVQRLALFEHRYGERFKPDAGWSHGTK